jgi:hypothetical protein
MKGLSVLKQQYGNRVIYEYNMGTIQIATMFFPDGRSKRTTYIVRTHFNQVIGKIDFSKDKHFETQEQAEKHILREFKKHIKDIGYHLGLWKQTTF